MIRLVHGSVSVRDTDDGNRFLFEQAYNTGSDSMEAATVFLRIACPRCHGGLCALPAEARFCPSCGLSLPEYCPATPFDARLDQSHLSSSNWRDLALRWVRWCNVPQVFHLPGRQPATVVAYTNALVNLGQHYESAHGANQNLQQAYRYFMKAARMGNTKAGIRLREMTPDADSQTQANPPKHIYL